MGSLHGLQIGVTDQSLLFFLRSRAVAWNSLEPGGVMRDPDRSGFERIRRLTLRRRRTMSYLSQTSVEFEITFHFSLLSGLIN